MPYSVCDRIVSLEPGLRGSAFKNVTFSEDYLAVHFPRYPVMPAAMMIDAVASVAGEVLASSLDQPAETFLISISAAKFRRFARPGDRLEMSVTSVARADDRQTAEFSAEITADGERVASIQHVVLGWEFRG